MKVEQLVDCFVERGYVTEKQAPWLSYALKKHMSSLAATIPILILASLLSTPIAAWSFYFSFSWLRSRTNGIHAKTFLGCLAASLLSVIIFMGLLYQLLTDPVIVTLVLGSVVIIWFFAPFNHPNMHLTREETLACATSAKRRVVSLLSGALVLRVLDLREASIGIILGIAMTAVLLALAYLFKGEGGER